LKLALELDTRYLMDESGSTPLDYSLEKNTPECTGVILDFITKSKKNFYKNIKEHEINMIIKYPSPNVAEMFDNAI
jgi:2-hydroxy-3-keto-5-methylthiopentenyl-1-phosphate phosphatase